MEGLLQSLFCGKADHLKMLLFFSVFLQSLEIYTERNIFVTEQCLCQPSQFGVSFYCRIRCKMACFVSPLVVLGSAEGVCGHFEI